MVNDLVGDSIARLKNALTRSRREVVLDHSKLVEQMCKILKTNKRITDYKVQKPEEGAVQQTILITIDPTDEELKPINDLKRISKPGLRIYRGYRDLKPVKEGYGLAILTTPKGVISDIDARKQKVGGEIICEIY